MPGISIFNSDEPISAGVQKNIDRAHSLIKSYDNFESTTILESNTIRAYFTANSFYPRSIINTGDFLICVDGLVTNKTDELVSSELRQLASLLFRNGNNKAEKLISQWIFSAEGEYIIFIYENNSHGFFLFNDPLGRLPLYYYNQNGLLLISREPKFIIRSLNLKSIDPVGIAEFLIFVYNLKHRTSIKDINRLQPASMISYIAGSKAKTIKTVYEWCFDSVNRSSSNVKDQASEMASLFVQATENYLNVLKDYHPLAALSGGLDSRAIYFGLIKTGANFSSYTSLDHSRANLADVEVAETIVASVPSDWRLYEYNPITLDDYKTVAYNQEGGSHITMASACDGYRKIKQEFPGKIAIYTGDGGNQVMSPMTTMHGFKSVGKLVDFLANSINTFKINDICALLKISISDIYDSLYEVLASYPENDALRKYAHFRTFGRGFHLVVENEDRSRFYYWLATPFWTVPMLRASMKVHEKYKRNLALYTEFFKAIDGRALDFKYANTGFKLNSFSSKIYAGIKGMARSQKWIYHHARKLVLKDNYSKARYQFLDDYIQKIIKSSALIDSSMNKDLLNKLLAGDINKLQYHLLYTVLLRMFLIDNDFKYI